MIWTKNQSSNTMLYTLKNCDSKQKKSQNSGTNLNFQAKIKQDVGIFQWVLLYASHCRCANLTIQQSILHVTQASEMMEAQQCIQQLLLKTGIFLYNKIMRANLVILVNFAKCNITQTKGPTFVWTKSMTTNHIATIVAIEEEVV